MEQFSIETSISEKTFTNIYLRMSWKPISVIVVAAIGAYFFYLAFTNVGQGGNEGWRMFAFYLILGLLVVLGRPALTIFRAKRQYQKLPLFKDKICCTFDDQKITIDYGDRGKSFMYWKDVVELKQVGDYILLFDGSGACYIDGEMLSAPQKDYILSHAKTR